MAFEINPTVTLPAVAIVVLIVIAVLLFIRFRKSGKKNGKKNDVILDVAGIADITPEEFRSARFGETLQNVIPTGKPGDNLSAGTLKAGQDSLKLEDELPEVNQKPKKKVRGKRRANKEPKTTAVEAGAAPKNKRAKKKKAPVEILAAKPEIAAPKEGIKESGVVNIQKTVKEEPVVSDVQKAAKDARNVVDIQKAVKEESGIADIQKAVKDAQNVVDVQKAVKEEPGIADIQKAVKDARNVVDIQKAVKEEPNTAPKKKRGNKKKAEVEVPEAKLAAPKEGTTEPGAVNIQTIKEEPGMNVPKNG